MTCDDVILLCATKPAKIQNVQPTLAYCLLFFVGVITVFAVAVRRISSGAEKGKYFDVISQPIQNFEYSGKLSPISYLLSPTNFFFSCW